ncbi:leukocyte surface antigen CD53-like isoform X1 [Schistocerca nitens]|uniref:leukocyte surface antigen CD53-like isoform X1 n=2 Tax=Schistocerca nitens TaxID=7011 RepID=UPI00211879F5|nr:leukocyte surface antigen CD53-like isoform X1 [Schistocerca nitens]XP_049805806.1 leukocyte surface antigen CD53-like isoform X1 [Schistocerca nitens]
MSCAVSILKYVLCFLNFLFVLSGVALVTIGTLMNQQLQGIEDVLNGKMHTPCTLAVVLGSFLIAVSFYGLFGAFKERRYYVVTYAVFLLTILLLQTPVAVMAILYGDRNFVLHTTMYDFTITYYTDSTSQDVMDTVQKKLQCCGATGPEDYVNLNPSTPEVLPPSCCIQDIECYYETNATETFYTKGCWFAEEEFLGFVGMLIGCAVVASGVLEVIGITMGFCLGRSLKKRKQ